MFRRGFGRFIIVSMLFFGALSLVGRWTYNAGWTDGYFDNQAAQVEAAPAEDASPPPVANAGSAAPAPRPYGYYGSGFMLFGLFFASLIKFGFFLLFAGFLFRLIVGRRWRHGRRSGWGKRPFAHHHAGCGPRGHHHHDDSPYEKRPEDVEPDIRTA